jgi:hypothetical protein
VNASVIYEIGGLFFVGFLKKREKSERKNKKIKIKKIK